MLCLMAGTGEVHYFVRKEGPVQSESKGKQRDVRKGSWLKPVSTSTTKLSESDAVQAEAQKRAVSLGGGSLRLGTGNVQYAYAGSVVHSALSSANPAGQIQGLALCKKMLPEKKRRLLVCENNVGEHTDPSE